MFILLVTTSTNAVRAALEREKTIKLLTIDCATLGVNVLEAIERIFHDSIPDLLITYRCPYILPKRIFEQCHIGSFNIHPSLLPKYPGLNPWDKIFHNKEDNHELFYYVYQLKIVSIKPKTLIKVFQ